MRSALSRRRFLASALGTVGLAAAGGCLTDLGVAETGFLAFKSVSVGWTHRGRPQSADLLWIWADGRGRLFGWYASEYAEIVRSPSDVRLGAETHRRLERDFAEVTLELGFARVGSTDLDLLETDWFKPMVSRADFDRVQFGDRAEVVFRFPRARLVDVYEGAQGDPDGWDPNVRPMDFGGTYAHRGVPIGTGRSDGRGGTTALEP